MDGMTLRALSARGRRSLGFSTGRRRHLSGRGVCLLFPEEQKRLPASPQFAASASSGHAHAFIHRVLSKGMIPRTKLSALSKPFG